MIGQMACDVCGNEIKSIEKLARLGANLVVDGITDLCPKCKFKVDEKAQEFRNAAQKQIDADVKEFIQKLHAKKS